jgi:hypothetical protein
MLLNQSKVCEMLRIPCGSQDWGIINSDHTRLSEFINFYINNADNLDIPVKMDLVDLIFESYNDFLLITGNNETIQSMFEHLVNILKKEPHLSSKLNYWKNLNIENDFPMVKFLKPLLTNTYYE